ncbi:hypothetical protein PAPYR_13178 [Paratrimastix pyriformis]|uniref:Uncharacterized protein n=1 Tax=Paratrimastix pyriformis TaxID=342808 RepID=A0ABQ8U0P6_9EUKA|nr:hypothetical protein PAPYR_13178 [Paratrimastix pyriformis]
MSRCFPAGQSALPRRWALSGVGNNYRYLAPEMPKLLGMWPLILVGLVKGIIQFQYWTEQMGAQCLHLHKTSEGMGNFGRRLVVTLGPRFLRVLEEGAAVLRRRDALGIVTLGWPERVEDNLAKMWQANLTEWYEENPMGTTSRREKTAVGDNLKKEENPTVGDNLKKEENPPSGTTSRAALGDIGWVGGIAGRHRLGGDGHGGKPQGDNLKKEENPAEGDNLMREGAEENPDFGENLDGGMEDHAGDGNASQAGDIGGILLWLRWLGLASLRLL